MNKKIKIIDLLNIIAKGEFPKRIKYNDNIYENKSTEYGIGYVTEYYEWFTKDVEVDDVKCLNDYVEILEDNTEEIEELEKEQEAIANPKTMLQEIRFYYDSNKMGDKINEIIRYIKRKDKNND